MKRPSLFLIILFILGICGCASSVKDMPVENTIVLNDIVPDSISGAYIKVMDKICDFGTVPKKHSGNLSLDFEIENIGNAPLVIYRTAVSCGCLSIDFSSKPVLPSEKTKLIANVDLRGQNKGVFDKTIIVESNADNDIILLHIKGIIK